MYAVDLKHKICITKIFLLCFFGSPSWQSLHLTNLYSHFFYKTAFS